MFAIKNKNNILLLSLAVFFSVIVGGFLPVTVNAQAAWGQQVAAVNTDCDEVDQNNAAVPVNSSNCGIIRYLVIFINVLSVLAGVAITASIAYAGIQYSMAGADPQKVSAAKDRIRNAIIALVFFIFGYAILNYLVPGGLIR